MSPRRLATGAVVLLLAACGPADDGEGPDAAPAAFVGRGACAECHAAEAGAWAGSDHDLAMDTATTATVLGDFAGAEFRHGGTTWTFTREEERFLVRRTGAAAGPAEVEAAYVFGHDPLQQLLVPGPGGRLQAFPIAWDSRPAAVGGGRWFLLFPEALDPDDDRRWDGMMFTWNFMCAECHSTRLEKAYDPATDAYATTWSEVDVSCEACHGPGSAHAAAARDGRGRPMPVDLAPAPHAWTIRPERGIAGPGPAERGLAQLDACGRCHSRRGTTVPAYRHGGPLLDTHRVSLLEEGLYHPDGQILDEVFVYGSFVQSRMARAGVACTDCHDPHSGRPRAAGNAICAGCHLASRFDVPEHLRHPPGTSGSACVDCHMPPRTYMEVDPRRDHRMGVPRPDLSVEIGVPNACTGCHDGRPPSWAAGTMDDWYGTGWRDRPEFGRAFAAARAGDPGARPALAALARDSSSSAIVRATALELLASTGLEAAELGATVRRALRDADPLVRSAAARAGRALPPPERGPSLVPALSDGVRQVRLDATAALAGAWTPASPEERVAWDAAVAEVRAAEMATAERPESRTNLGLLEARLGRVAEAEAQLAAALRLDSAYVPAIVNLADLYRATGRDPDAERLLRRGLEIVPDAASLRHSFGLLLVRQGRTREAMEELRAATELEPSNPRFAYVYAVALHDAGRSSEALRRARSHAERWPGDPDIGELVAFLERQLSGG